ncbi:MAG: hypothetical protein WAQ26_03720 [Candidatus Saccharimonas aalborgensis]
MQLLIAFGVQFKSLNNKRRTPFVYDDSFSAYVVYVANRRITRKLSTPDFLAQTSFGILGQIVYIVFGLTKRNTQHKLTLTGILKPESRELQ